MGRKMTCREAIIQALPKEWDDDETRIVRWATLDLIVAANPKFAPMMYGNGKWEEVNFCEHDFLNSLVFKQERLFYNG